MCVLCVIVRHFTHIWVFFYFELEISSNSTNKIIRKINIKKISLRLEHQTYWPSVNYYKHYTKPSNSEAETQKTFQ